MFGSAFLADVTSNALVAGAARSSPAKSSPSDDGLTDEDHLAAVKRFYEKHNAEKLAQASELFGKYGRRIWELLEKRYPKELVAPFVPAARGST